MNVIMLDFDGVIHNARSVTKASGTLAPPEPTCIAALNRLTAALEASLVISSSGRRSFSLSELVELTKRWGIVAPVIGCTPCLNHKGVRRGEEIAAWLAAETTVPIKFLILDDGNDVEPFERHLCKTCWATGLTEEDVDLAIKVWKLLYEA